MRQLLALMMCAVSLGAAAQNNNSYNPDGNGDGIIGVSDLQDLLALYGLSVDADSLVWYGTADLNSPSWCEWGDGCPYLQVPQDADVIYYTGWPENFLTGPIKLALPEIPKTLVVFDCGTSSWFQNTYISNELKWGFGPMGNSPTVDILMEFDNRWYLVN